MADAASWRHAAEVRAFVTAVRAKHAQEADIERKNSAPH
jgi:hypothetical protein